MRSHGLQMISVYYWVLATQKQGCTHVSFVCDLYYFNCASYANETGVQTFLEGLSSLYLESF